MKNRIKISSIISILLIIINNNLFSQDTNPEYNKNTVFITVGSFGILGGANLNYERFIFKTNKSILSSFWLKAGGGYWYEWVDNGTQFYISAEGLTGHNNSHIEYGLGITSLYDAESYRINVSNYESGHESKRPTKWGETDITAIGNLGYRYQKPKGHFIFRTGIISTPIALYISLGVVF